jgi:hypothetical protein
MPHARTIFGKLRKNQRKIANDSLKIFDREFRSSSHRCHSTIGRVKLSALDREVADMRDTEPQAPRAIRRNLFAD